jgi:hypothetical protein
MTATPHYQQFLLGLGAHEDARLPFLVIVGNFEDGGFNTWQEAVTHFRDCLVELVNEEESEEAAGCLHCVNLVLSEEDTYCRKCGRQLPDQVVVDIDAKVTALFRSWFDLGMHEFHDWSTMSENGWEIGTNLEAGPLVQIHNFDRLLNTWTAYGEGRFQVAIEDELVKVL